MKKLILLLFITCVSFYPFDANAQTLDLHGFVEVDVGAKVSDDQTKRDDFNMLETRLQLKTTHYFEGDHYLTDKGGILNFKGDILVDGYFEGKTDFELREFNLSLTPMDIMDVKLGRQVLTWGTGDYLFINDLFPKDYISFFIGRNDEYLKKPSDALKFSFYPQQANIDFIVIPYFTPNTVGKGDRLSLFDSFQKGIAGISSDRHIISPPFQMENNEYALRVYRSFGSNEAALYFFHGFDKNPNSYKDESLRQLYYRPMDAYGASIRGPFVGGIGNLEAGYYHSREDSDGSNRLVENSQFKLMGGLTKDLGNDLKIGVQYLYEKRLDFDNYETNLLATDYRFDEHRHLWTNRITKLYKNQTVMVSLFTFYSPSDDDGYVRPSVSYDINDQWKATFGANLPWGEDDLTEFGQNKRNKSVFVRVRYNF